MNSAGYGLPGESPFVVAEDLVGSSPVADRQGGAASANLPHFVPQATRAGATLFPQETLTQCLDHRFGEGFAGLVGELSGQPVGFGMLDAKGHGRRSSVVDDLREMNP